MSQIQQPRYLRPHHLRQKRVSRKKTVQNILRPLFLGQFLKANFVGLNLFFNQYLLDSILSSKQAKFDAEICFLYTSNQR